MTISKDQAISLLEEARAMKQLEGSNPRIFDMNSDVALIMISFHLVSNVLFAAFVSSSCLI